MLLFLCTWLIGSAGAVLGSMLGAAFDRHGDHALLFGAILGGALATVAAVRLAEWRGWVPRDRRNRVLAGTLLGFVLACVITTQTLSSPIGPGLSSLLIGAGAVLANRR